MAAKAKIDWTKPCSYDSGQKALFHREAKKRLKELADRLGFAPGTYDLRSNQGGIAVSGEVTLHHGDVYVQVAQPAMGPGNGILMRTCRDRKDYTGGPNRFGPLSWLDDLPALEDAVRRVMREKVGYDGDSEDAGYNPRADNSRRFAPGR